MALTKVGSGVIQDDAVGIANLGATGTASATTFLRGDNAWASAAAGFNSIQVFTASGTWTRPSGITKVVIHAVGGGGAGGGGYSSTYWGQAGGGGAYFIKYLDVSAIATSVITIGAGGTAVAQSTVGTTGGNTIWAGGGALTANGGAGGDKGYNNGHGSSYGTGGTTSSGDVNFTGSRGTNGSAGGTIPGIPMGGWGFSPYDYATAGNRVSTGYGYGGWTANASPWSYAGGGGLIIVWEYK